MTPAEVGRCGRSAAARPLATPAALMPRRGREPPPARYDRAPIARRLFTLLSALSLLLCAAVVVLWVRSYFAGEKVTYGWTALPERRQVTLLGYTNRGMLFLSRYDVRFSGPIPPGFWFWGDPSGRLRWERYRPYAPAAAADRYLLGFRATDASRTSTLSYPPGVGRVERWRVVAVPLWVLVLALGVWPAARVWLWRRRRGARRVAQGLCPSCGYDLRATPGRCPECGGLPAANEGRSANRPRPAALPRPQADAAVGRERGDGSGAG